MLNATNLLNDIQKAKDNWNERSQFKLKNVGNLSMSDLDTLELYADNYLQYGYINNLMCPMGTIKEVMEKYGFNAC